MGLRRFRLRIDRLLAMALREMGMVRCFLARAGFLVMTRGVLMMLDGFFMMGCGLL